MSAGEKIQDAEDAAQEASSSKPVRALVMFGLITLGVIHILIGILAVQMAWGARSGETDQKGALAEVGSTPLGGVLLWVVAVGFFGLFIYKMTQAAWGYHWEEKKSKRIRKRIAAAVGAVGYLLFGISAIRLALGARQESSDQKHKTLVGDLLAQPAGVALAIAVAIAILIYAGVQIKKGVTSSFTKELLGEPSPAAKRLGQIGYTAKGIAYATIGILFGWAAISFDPEKAGGLDQAFATVNAQPAGPVLLTIIALGFVAFGVYCFSWSRHARS